MLKDLHCLIHGLVSEKDRDRERERERTTTDHKFTVIAEFSFKNMSFMLKKIEF